MISPMSKFSSQMNPLGLAKRRISEQTSKRVVLYYYCAFLKRKSSQSSFTYEIACCILKNRVRESEEHSIFLLAQGDKRWILTELAVAISTRQQMRVIYRQRPGQLYHCRGFWYMQPTNCAILADAEHIWKERLLVINNYFLFLSFFLLQSFCIYI